MNGCSLWLGCCHCSLALSGVCLQEDIHELVEQEARVDQLIAHVKEQLKKLVRWSSKRGVLPHRTQLFS